MLSAVQMYRIAGTPSIAIAIWTLVSARMVAERHKPPVAARRLQPGDCLFTTRGTATVKRTRVARPPGAAVPGRNVSSTYTLELPADFAYVVVGGVFTHARGLPEQ